MTINQLTAQFLNDNNELRHALTRRIKHTCADIKKARRDNSREKLLELKNNKKIFMQSLNSLDKVFVVVSYSATEFSKEELIALFSPSAEQAKAALSSIN